MKRHLAIGFLLLLALAGCHQPKNPEPEEGPTKMDLASPELQAIDSLIGQQPDSALALLLPWLDSVQANETFDRHYAHLLLSELLYKNYRPQENREELLNAVAYLDSLLAATYGVDARRVSLRQNRFFQNLRRHCGLDPQSPAQNRDLYFLAARAHYINGVGYYERDSLVQACKEYIQALEIMEERFGEKELEGKRARLLALTHMHLAGLFSDLYLHEQAIYFGKKSLYYYRKYDAPPRHIAWMLNEIGSQYEMKVIFDSACSYYQMGIKALPDTNNITYRDLTTHLTFCSYKKKESQTSLLRRLYDMLEQAESEKERLSRCLTLGEFFYHEKQLDSARVYLDKVYEGAQSVGAKKQAAEWLAEICRLQGQNDKIREYADFLVPFANTNENQGALKSRLIELCHDYKQFKQEEAHQKRVKKLVGWSVTVLAIVATLASTLVLVNKKRHKYLKAQKEETEKKMKEREIQHSAAMGRAKNTIEHLLEENKMLNERKAHEDVDNVQPKAPKEEYEALMREGLCVNIRQRMKKADAYTSFDVKDYPSLALSSKELSELIIVIDKHCPNFSTRLKRQYPELNGNDMQLCRLYLMGLKVLQVAILLSTDYSSVRKRTNRLKKKTGCEELHLQLKSLFFEAE